MYKIAFNQELRAQFFCFEIYITMFVITAQKMHLRKNMSMEIIETIPMYVSQKLHVHSNT